MVEAYATAILQDMKNGRKKIKTLETDEMMRGTLLIATTVWSEEGKLIARGGHIRTAEPVFDSLLRKLFTSDNIRMVIIDY